MTGLISTVDFCLAWTVKLGRDVVLGCRDAFYLGRGRWVTIGLPSFGPEPGSLCLLGTPQIGAVNQ